MEGKAILVGQVLLVVLGAFVVIASSGVVSPQHTQVHPLLLPREKSCPVAEDIVPCVCTVSAELQDLRLDCSLVQDETQLRSVFQASFPDTDFLELVIEQDQSDPNTNLTAIKQDTLGDAVSFQSIRISGTKLGSVESYALSNSYQTLTHLDLTNNNIEYFPFASLPRYVALQTFIIEANSVTSLHSIISSSLQVLSASFNPLSTLPASTFKGSSALTEVYLGYADLIAMEPGHFTHLENLTKLDLGGNTITVLEESSIVTASHTISYLNLNSNQLSFVRHDAISGQQIIFLCSFTKYVTPS